MALRKTEKADIRKRYPIYVEIGVIVALALLIAAFRIPLQTNSDFEAIVQTQETVQLKEVTQTQQQKQPPPPPRPPVPVEVPNEQILEDQNLNFDASLDLSESLEQTPPPPPPEEEKKEPEIFMVVEHMPEPIGGMQAIYDIVEYPEFARKAGIEGTVFVQFTVNEDGSVVDPVVMRSPHELLSEEALRAIQELKFTPGKQRGQAVKVRMSLPVRFQLQ